MMIYFMRAGGAVKIGYTQTRGSLTRRLDAVQCGNPEQVTIVAIMTGDPADEQRLHAHFAQHRLRGEWFTLHHEIRLFIEANARPCIQGIPAPEDRSVAKAVGPGLLTARSDINEGIKAFISACIVKGGEITAGTLYGALTTWWALNAGEVPIPSKNVIAEAMKKRGYRRTRRGGLSRYAATLRPDAAMGEVYPSPQTTLLV